MTHSNNNQSSTILDSQDTGEHCQGLIYMDDDNHQKLRHIEFHILDFCAYQINIDLIKG